jgi:uncharacterized caspase-like protein
LISPHDCVDAGLNCVQRHRNPKAGSTASDGAGTNSPYTLALANHLATPGLDVRLALGRVRDEVLKSTGNKQEPFVYGSLGVTGVTVTLHSID